MVTLQRHVFRFAGALARYALDLDAHRDSRGELDVAL